MTITKGQTITLKDGAWTVERIIVDTKRKVAGVSLVRPAVKNASGDVMVGAIDGVYLTSGMLRAQMVQS